MSRRCVRQEPKAIENLATQLLFNVKKHPETRTLQYFYNCKVFQGLELVSKFKGIQGHSRFVRTNPHTLKETFVHQCSLFL